MLGLKDKEIQRIKEELINCKRPIFLFHDDADGICSFLLLYRFIREGQGVIVKSKPPLDEKFANKIIDYEADKVFILDISQVKQELIDTVKRRVIWIDHHPPQEISNVSYFNPRKHKKDAVYPVTNICYDIVKQDLWIAMTGCIGDWYIPEFKDEFCEKYPDLFDKNINNPAKALFESKIGKIAQIMNFITKGKAKDAMKCIKILTRIRSPYEILNKESGAGKFLYKRYERINEEYEKLLEDIKSKVNEDEFLVYTYPSGKMAYTGELTNELLYLYPDKIIIVGRDISGEIRMSLRANKVKLLPLLEKALVGIEGYGGGHEYACGACVKKEQFKEFLGKLKLGVSEG